MTPQHEPLWHGYSFDDIDHLARIVVALRHRSQTAASLEDLLADVRFAIIEHLATSEELPERTDLLGVGHAAAQRYVRQEMQTHGVQKTDRIRGNGEGGFGSLPGFQRYWQAGGRTPLDERVVERIALRQIWPLLPLKEQQAVMARAITGDHQDAARTLGVSLDYYWRLLRAGRRRAAALWHEHETPRRLQRNRRAVNRVNSGRPRLTGAEVEALRDRRVAGATLAQLAREVGYSVSGLSDLLAGKNRPSPDPAAQAA